MTEMQEVNVQVAVRVRPLLPKEEHGQERVCVKVIPSTNQLVLGKDKVFTFDHVLSSKLTQRHLYERCVEQLVRSCFEGYNATIFAYGQTGSGKTYTMGGGYLGNLVDDDLGIIPRAIQQIFDFIVANSSRKYTIRVSYIEIYKEDLYDLLDLDSMSKDLHIREDNIGNTVIVGVTEIECETMDDVMSYLERGSTYRRTGLTQMNENSSRSHSIFTLLIEQRWTGDENQVGTSVSRKSAKKSEATAESTESLAEIEHYMCAKFHFVDLAGSERANRSGNVGERFKESVHINSGLLALGNVISALGDSKRRSASHIPYRDSKITRLLKDSLGGNAKTLMICCISPAASSFDESLNSLKYANRARNIRNKPIINRDPQSLRFEEMQSEIKALREELHRQQTAVSATPQRGTRNSLQETEYFKQMEEKLSQTQVECSHYGMLADEAYRLLISLRDKNSLSNSLAGQLCDWLELVDEMKNRVPTKLEKGVWDNRTINRLESELEQCKNDLKCDEEIFAERARMLEETQASVSHLEEENAGLRSQLEAAEESIRRLEEQVLAKQIEFDNVNAQLKTSAIAMQKTVDVSIEAGRGSLDFCVDATSGHTTDNITSRPRAVSVPAHFMITERSMVNKQELARDIHTSPPTFTVGRVVNNFRARTALIVSRMEDRDDVLQKTFDDSDEGEVGHPDGIVAIDNDGFKFVRNNDKRATFRVKPSAHLNRPTVEPNRLKKQANGYDSFSVQEESIVDLSSTGDWAVKRTTTQILHVGGSDHESSSSSLRDSMSMRSRQLRQAELDAKKSMQKMKDLNINIRLKEQLIRQLVKSGQEAQRISEERGARIQALEEEKAAANADLVKLQKTLDELMARENTDKPQKDLLLVQYRKKMDVAKTRVQALKAKQKEVDNIGEIVNTATSNNKRVQELESAVSYMRTQHDQLQKHMKDVAEQKVRLERDVQREQQRIRELEMSTEKNRKVLKVKMDELSVMQRRLRSAGLPVTAIPTSEEQSRLEDQRKWLDQEMEVVLHQRKAVEDLEKELQQREDIVARKETMLAEKNELEMKKLRSSQTVARDVIIRVSSRLESVDRLMEEKNREMSLTSSQGQMQIREEMEILRKAREKLLTECSVLQARTDGLSVVEERRLVELEEEIEALDAAIEFKNDSIASRQQDLRRSVSLVRSSTTLLTVSNGLDTNNRLAKLNVLTTSELRSLLSRYFDRIVDLRDGQRRMQSDCVELEMKVDEQMVRIAELESCLERSAMDVDRRLTQQQQDYEKRIHLLMKQVAEADLTGHSDLAIQLGEKDSKIADLEKDLYYYKSTSRELKKKLRQTAKDKDSGFEREATPNGAEGGEYVDSQRSVAATSEQTKAAPLEPGRSSSRPSSGGVGATGSNVERSSNPAKPITPRDVLNSASVRGDLFPRLPGPSTDAVSSSKRAMTHSGATQSLAKPSTNVYVADISIGHNGATAFANDLVESKDKPHLVPRPDPAMKASSSALQHGTNLPHSEKPITRVVPIGADGDSVMNAAPVPTVVQKPQRVQRRNSKEMPPRRPPIKSSQDEKGRISLVDSLDAS